MTQGHLKLAQGTTADGCSPGLQSGEVGFQTRLNALAEFEGFSPGVCILLNADRISSLQENWALYQDTTTLVVPKTIENMSGF